jgi:hypothetical protein
MIRLARTPRGVWRPIGSGTMVTNAMTPMTSHSVVTPTMMAWGPPAMALHQP